MLNLIIGWNEPDIVAALNSALKAGVPLKTSEQAPSARTTKPERYHVAKIRFDLAQDDCPGTVGTRGAGTWCNGDLLR